MPSQTLAALPNALPARLSFLPTADQMAAFALDDRKESFLVNFPAFITPKVRARLKGVGGPAAVDAVAGRALELAHAGWDGVGAFVRQGVAGGTPAASSLNEKVGYLVGDAIKAQRNEDTWHGRKAQSLDWNGREGDAPPRPRADVNSIEPLEQAAAAEEAMALLAGDGTARTAAYLKLHAFIASQGMEEPGFSPEELRFKFRTGARTLGQVLEDCRADFKQVRNLIRTGDDQERRRLARGKDSRQGNTPAPSTPQAFAKAGEILSRMDSDEGLADRFGLAGTPEQRKNAIQRWRSDALKAHQARLAA